MYGSQDNEIYGAKGRNYEEECAWMSLDSGKWTVGGVFEEAVFEECACGGFESYVRDFRGEIGRF